jgi:hypothetical protein
MSAMIRRIHPIFLLLFFALAGFQCRRDKMSPTPAVLTGKLVVVAPCDYFVVQVLGGPIPDSCVVKSWTDSATDSTYSNVFTLAGTSACYFGQSNLSKGDIVTFTLSGPYPGPECVRCNIAPSFPMPSASNWIAVDSVIH